MDRNVYYKFHVEYTGDNMWSLSVAFYLLLREPLRPHLLGLHGLAVELPGLEDVNLQQDRVTLNHMGKLWFLTGWTLLPSSPPPKVKKHG